MSLIKYTIFMNSLLTDFKMCNLCCKIYRTPSTSLDSADDLAAYYLNNVCIGLWTLCIDNGCTWQYNFYTKKGGAFIEKALFLINVMLKI